jgi:hypothetical protein
MSNAYSSVPETRGASSAGPESTLSKNQSYNRSCFSSSGSSHSTHLSNSSRKSIRQGITRA